MNKKIVLLGDSIIDNTLYVNKHDVEQHLNTLLEDDTIVNHSIDGSTTVEVLDFISTCALDKDTTHFVISVGGNNLLDKKQFLLDKTIDDWYKTMLIQQDIYSEISPDLMNVLTYTHYSGYMLDVEKIAVLLQYRYPKAKIMFLGLYEGNSTWNPEWEPVEHLLPGLINTHNEKLQHMIGSLSDNGINASYIDITNTLKQEDYFNDIEPNDSGGLLIAEKISTHITE